MVLGLLALTDVASVLVHLGYTKLWPMKTTAGIVLFPDYSKAKMILFDWLYASLEFMGRSFFALLLYFGAIALVRGRPERQALGVSVGRNAPYPCGSGLKAKRCCGA